MDRKRDCKLLKLFFGCDHSSHFLETKSRARQTIKQHDVTYKVSLVNFIQKATLQDFIRDETVVALRDNLVLGD